MKKILLWGFILWLIGYILGIVFFALVPPDQIGWVIMPIGVIITVWVIWKKFQEIKPSYYFKVGLTWAIMAIILDYLFLVLVFKPADGYYKLDVYLYYILTLVIPLLVGWAKSQKRPASQA